MRSSHQVEIALLWDNKCNISQICDKSNANFFTGHGVNEQVNRNLVVLYKLDSNCTSTDYELGYLFVDPMHMRKLNLVI